MAIKSFRGQMATDTQKRISLSTRKGKVGYRITKLDVISAAPATSGHESVLKVYSTKQTSNTATIDFGDSDLLASAFYAGNTASNQYPVNIVVVFDSGVVNQDIYVTHLDPTGNNALNFYIEMEVINLSDTAAEYTTIRDIRSNVSI